MKNIKLCFETEFQEIKVCIDKMLKSIVSLNNIFSKTFSSFCTIERSRTYIHTYIHMHERTYVQDLGVVVAYVLRVGIC
jgi:hypothetical protein